MDFSIYLSVRLPEKRYERIPVANIQSTSKICDLKIHASNLLQFSHEKMEFIYSGLKLEDNKTLDQERILHGSTIHVFKKQEAAPKPPPVTEDEINRAVQAFKAEEICLRNLQQEDIQKILDEYPDFYTDLGAFSILKDAVFLNKLKTIQFARKCAEHYPTLIRAAEFIVKIRREAHNRDLDWSNSSSPSEGESHSEGETSAAPATNQGERLINRRQLEAALSLASSTMARYRDGASSSTTPTTTATTPNSTADIPTIAVTPPNRNELLLRDGEPAQQAQNQQLLQQQYSAQLQTLIELGFLNQQTNLEALIYCDGHVEAAINFLISNAGNYT